MRLSHPDYIKLVTKTYFKMRANKELSFLLAHPTRARIRKACMHVYEERYLKEDKQVLKDFFGPAEQGKKFLEVIRDFEADRFRPLDNYLREITENTDDTNIELLAWLIDFKYRPFEYGNNVILSDEELSLIDDSVNSPEVSPVIPDPEPADPEEEENEEDGTNAGGGENPLMPEGDKGQESEVLSLIDSGKKTEGSRLKKAVIIILGLVISIGGVCTFRHYERSGDMAYGNAGTGCMYWAKDHYEPVPCNEDARGRIFLPLNEKKMSSFQMITNKDTITEWSIGKIYCIKDSNQYKYYTEGGNYPEDLKRPLKILSRRIYDGYLNKKETPGKDSLAE